MSRWIDADYLIDTIGTMIGYGTTPTAIWDMVNNAPSIDIVRCGECKHRVSGRMGKMCYGRHPDDYCSYGERKESE